VPIELQRKATLFSRLSFNLFGPKPILHTSSHIEHTPNWCKNPIGGLKLGFIKVGYHVVIAERVTIPEK
jgi:hypothetical protein